MYIYIYIYIYIIYIIYYLLQSRYCNNVRLFSKIIKNASFYCANISEPFR